VLGAILNCCISSYANHRQKIYMNCYMRPGPTAQHCSQAQDGWSWPIDSSTVVNLSRHYPTCTHAKSDALRCLQWLHVTGVRARAVCMRRIMLRCGYASADEAWMMYGASEPPRFASAPLLSISLQRPTPRRSKSMHMPNEMATPSLILGPSQP